MGQAAPNSIDGAAHFGDCKGAVNRSRARVCGPRREAAYARRMIVCLGEAIVDLVCERELAEPGEADHFVPHPGGALANVAVAARRAGAEAALMGGIGDDAWGSWLREKLWQERVDVRWLETTEEIRTPVAFVTFNWAREPSFAIYGEGIAQAMRAATSHLSDAIESAEALVFGSNTLVGEPERELTLRARRAARDRGAKILFDPNLRPNRWRDMGMAARICREMMDGAFVVRANEWEARELSGESEPAAAAQAFCEEGALLGVVTNRDGAVMRGAVSAEVGSPKVEVVSPLGAGDAFTGALAAELGALDWEPARAAEALPGAVKAGAHACTGWGAQV
jgi:sugar/nucleoside kinase (ribokinase family)